jgi:hypothetical protein
MARIDLGVCPGRLHPGDPGRTVVVLPGAQYPPAAPLLWFAREAAQRRSWTVLEVWDEYRDEPDWVDWAPSRARAALERVSGSRVVLVGKSLSSTAASVAADEQLPAVWLTPLLREPPVVDALGGATAPTLLVGGTADPLWDGRAARGTGGDVLELVDADHSLQVAGDIPESLRLLGEVATAVDRFLAESA